ncbi:Hypothetical protein CHV_a0337 [Cardinium endosymbiont cBtQ1 of Bemisia tabaci]|uniref:hypothetical protein n=1 Tax=Cardinium endosymbiont of Bemisia tabaci TaxID=672794 RepID=UPI000442D0EA|nr:hypothetical protein [Cardinium endosymbiont of Bemisia tabaci]CDG49652.1 Hypothetical protein CHV_a0337 [Cardinium endosymbiont cBtQ1 of Bemisia tabaci]
MLNRSARKINPFFLHYFLFYAIFAACFGFFSCNRVRMDLIPKRNTILGTLSEDGKTKYLKLVSINDDTGKKKIEEAIRNIKTPDALEKFIDISIENQTIYNRLLKLLPKSERPSFQAYFHQADLDAQTKLIKQNKKLLDQINRSSGEQHYIDLLEIVSNEEAIALKNKILNATKPEEINQLITSTLPNPFQQLSDDNKAILSKIKDDARQEILKSIHCNSQKDGIVNHDLDALIKQKEQAQSKKDKEAVPADGWGPKLSLEGEERRQFLFSIIEFPQSDQNSLKDLFDKVDPDSISNFLSVYYSGFNKKERIELLSTIIYLYKGWPELTIKLCNTPSSLSLFDKFGLFRKTQKHQLELLTKLDELLQE